MSMFGLFKKRELSEPVLETFEVTLPELPGWFEGIMEGEIKEKKKQAEEMYRAVLDKFSDIRASLEKLDRARITGTERLHIAANMIKEGFVKKKYVPLNTLNSITGQYKPDYAYFIDFQERGMRAIGELKESTPKQTILLSRYFKKESTELVDSIRHSEDALLKLREFLKTGSGAMGTLKRIRETVVLCGDLVKEIHSLDAEARGMEDRITGIKKRKSELEKKFLNLLKSKEWNEMNSLKKEEADITKKASDAEMKLSSELSSLKRPLKSIDHLFSKKGNLTPIHKNTLRDFIRNPFKAVMKEGGDKSMVACLNAVRKGLSKMDIKQDHDIEDITERFENRVPELKSSYLDQKKTLKSMKENLKELSMLSVKKEGLENEIKKISDDVGRIDEMLGSTKSKRILIKDKISERIKETEAIILEESQKKVTIEHIE